MTEYDETTPLFRSSYVEIGSESEEVSRVDKVLLKIFNQSQLSTVKSVLGYLMVVLAGLLFTLANVLQKIVVPEISFWQLMFYRGIIQIVIMTSEILFKRRPVLSGNHKIRILLQGQLGGILLLCIFIAVKHVPLGNASAIFFCTPLFTFFFATCMLRERMGMYRVVICIFMLQGVIHITRPPFMFAPDNDDCQNNTGQANVTQGVSKDSCEDEHFNLLGYLCAIAVPMLSAIVSILTRQLKSDNASVLMFWFGVGTFNASIVGKFIHG